MNSVIRAAFTGGAAMIAAACLLFGISAAGCDGSSGDTAGNGGAGAGTGAGTGTGTGTGAGGTDDCGDPPEGLDCIDCDGNLAYPSCSNGEWVCDDLPMCSDCGPFPGDLVCLDGCSAVNPQPICDNGIWSCDLVVKCQAAAVWSKVFKGARPTAVAVDAAGGFVVTGTLRDTDSVGGDMLTPAGGDDILVARFDAAGQHVWSERFGGAGKDQGESIALDAVGNIYLYASFGGEITIGADTHKSMFTEDHVLAKLDPSGAPLWSKVLGAGPSTVAVDAADNLVISGEFGGTIDLGGGPLQANGGSGVFVAKIDKAGAHVWSKALVAAPYSYNKALALRADGGVLVGGTFRDTMDVGGNMLQSSGDFDGYFVELGPDGKLVQAHALGGAGRDGVSGVAALPAGGAAVYGSFADTFKVDTTTLQGDELDGYLLTFDAQASVATATVISGVTNKVIGREEWHIAATGAGEIVMGGQFQDNINVGGWLKSSAGDYDIILAKLNDKNEAVRAQAYGDQSSDSVAGFALDPAGDAIVVGEFWGALDLGNGHPGLGTDRAFLAKIPMH